MSKKKAFTQKPRCGYCRHPGFDLVGYSWPSIRPKFQCQKCQATWTSGRDGKPYLDSVVFDKTDGLSPEEWIEKNVSTDEYDPDPRRCEKRMRWFDSVKPQPQHRHRPKFRGKVPAHRL